MVRQCLAGSGNAGVIFDRWQRLVFMSGSIPDRCHAGMDVNHPANW